MVVDALLAWIVPNTRCPVSAAWMAVFHLRFSGKTRFDFWRWVLMFFGASVFGQAFGLWVAAQAYWPPLQGTVVR